MFTLYISCVYVLVFKRKPSLRLVNRFDSLKVKQTKNEALTLLNFRSYLIHKIIMYEMYVYLKNLYK